MCMTRCASTCTGSIQQTSRLIVMTIGIESNNVANIGQQPASVNRRGSFQAARIGQNLAAARRFAGNGRCSARAGTTRKNSRVNAPRPHPIYRP
ncbi:hypothetical protein B0G57_101149 [Trinickia symbiotica]|uniref:Uncharacterized protein n=1 Tax=Trinickia symbiotica TaxID=863227 RepID=A0A2N7X941_9BURK|nr:hypothetical protein C0Z20_04945 [Trinickia symbiotica]PPK47185.1 hypothetical protein B0G57_101149 [Trinickia symbiotica]